MTTSMPIAAMAIDGLYQNSSPRFIAPTVTDCATTGPTPASSRRIALMPIAALASSPVERWVKNRVGSRSNRSHTAGCSAASIRPSRRRMDRFSSSVNAAATTPLTITARHTWTIRPVCAVGTYSPSTLPVATGTSAPIATVTRPASSSADRSPRVPRRLNRSRPNGVRPRSGSGR